jgi:hypothetical protein
MANSNGWGDGAGNNAIGWGQGANNNIGWGDSHAKSWAGLTDIVGIDADAQAFITAAAITGATQQAAIDTLVKGLKTDGIYSKMKAVYPFVTDNRNLMSYTEDFSNAYWLKFNTTINSNTITAPNGTLTADSLVENTANNEHNFRVTINNLLPSTTYTYSIYVKYNDRQFVSLASYLNAAPFPLYTASFDLINQTIASQSAANGGTIVASNIEGVGNGWFRISISGQVGANSNNIVFQLNLQNDSQNSVYLGSGRSVYIWGAQLELGSTATTYQPIATTQQAYIASQFKFNLVNPVDSDAAFRLVFNGGWTHSSNGATPNGTNGYADTYVNDNTQLALDSAHISIYSRTNTDGLICDMGVASTTDGINIFSKYTNVFYPRIHDNNSGIANTANSLGLFTSNRVNSTEIRAFQNNSLKLITSNSVTKISNNITLGVLNGAIKYFYSNRQYAFSTIGDGLTDTEAANLYTRVQAYQTALSRQV